VSINSKTPFLNKLFISLCRDFVNSGEVYSGVVISGFIGVSLMNINIFAVFCWSFVGSYYICFNLWRSVLAAGSSLGSSVGSSVSSLVNSLVSSLVGS